MQLHTTSMIFGRSRALFRSGNKVVDVLLYGHLFHVTVFPKLQYPIAVRTLESTVIFSQTACFCLLSRCKPKTGFST